MILRLVWLVGLVLTFGALTTNIKRYLAFETSWSNKEYDETSKESLLPVGMMIKQVFIMDSLITMMQFHPDKAVSGHNTLLQYDARHSQVGH